MVRGTFYPVFSGSRSSLDYADTQALSVSFSSGLGFYFFVNRERAAASGNKTFPTPRAPTPNSTIASFLVRNPRNAAPTANPKPVPGRPNLRPEHAEFGGGNGGAVYTAQHAVTTLSRKATFRNNRSGGVGGAVHSAGVTILQRDGIFRGNSALVSLLCFSGAGGRQAGNVFLAHP